MSRMSESNHAIAILGGTGDQGLGLALRFAQVTDNLVLSGNFS